MNTRERFIAILTDQPVDKMPVMHMGFWGDLLNKWVYEGHLKPDEIIDIKDGSPNDTLIGRKLGFDCNIMPLYWDNSFFSPLYPEFERKVLSTNPDGSYTIINGDGAIVLQRDGATSIASEISHTLVDRKSWEEHYVPRLQFTEKRFDPAEIEKMKLESATRDLPLGLFCKSLFGQIRNWMGVVGISYLYVDDEELYDEIIKVTADLSYNIVKYLLKTGIQFDFAHFWEDICFKNGPLVNPVVFEKKVGPHYKRITDLLKENDIKIISLDSDGDIMDLAHVWLDNGINTLMPIEVGTWGGSIVKLRQKFGNNVKGMGGMNKHVFELDYRAIDKEIERLRPMIEMGGYLPAPDHRITPEAKWEVIQYYCDQMRKYF